jgi:hypothetical protein
MSLELKLPGLIIPPLTPFNDRQQVDYALLETGVNYVVADCNAAMVIAAGVEAQEYHYLKLEERKELHKMEIEIRKVEQDERDKERDQHRQDREAASKEEKGNEHWLKSFWRPAMGWLYMGICFMDFIGFPLLTIFLPIIFKPFGLTMPYTAWKSLTLDNGGLIHIAFGAILGVAAFSRGAEKAAPAK